MRRLIPQSEEIQNAGREIDEQKGGQKSADFDAERGGADAECHRPKHEQSRILGAMQLELLAHLRKVTPFLGRYGDPFDAATAGEKRYGNGDQPKPDPNGPPVFFAKQLAPWRAAGERATMGSLGDFRHRGLRLTMCNASPKLSARRIARSHIQVARGFEAA